jgi:hypothetical protein
METLPFPRDRYSTPAAEAIIARGYSLSLCGPEMKNFPDSAFGTQGIEPVEDPDARLRLMAEIDALVAREVYRLNREGLLFRLDPDCILRPDSGVETFRALRNREMLDNGPSTSHRRAGSCRKV